MEKRRRKQRKDAARVRFILNDRSTSEALVYLAIRVNRKRVLWSTGERVNPKDWSTKTRRAIVRARSAELQALNERLNSYEKTALALYREWQLDNPTAAAAFNQDTYKLELDYRTDKQARPEVSNAKLDTSDFIRFAESIRDQRKDSPSIVRGTWKVLNNHTNLLREFADAEYSGAVPFADVDELFIDNFKRFLFRVKGHNRRTVHKVLLSLRSVASRAARRELMKYDKDFKKWAKQEFRKLPQPGLSRDELDKVIALDLSDNLRLERVRDLFLIGVLTAQRRSDFKKLAPKNFHRRTDGGYRYHIQSQKKTLGEAKGPVMEWGVPLLEKYGYIGGGPFNPPAISDQKFNEYLKEVIRLAIPDATFATYDDAEEIDFEGRQVPKWSVVGSHAARRTAVGLLRSMGAPDWQIMEMTGHKSIAEMTGYDVRGPEAVALELGKRLDAAWSNSKLRVAK